MTLHEMAHCEIAICDLVLWEMVFCGLVYYEIVLCAVVLLRNLNLLNGHNVIKT